MYFRFLHQIFASGKSRDQFINSLPLHKKRQTKFRLIIYNYLLEIGENRLLPVFDTGSAPGGRGVTPGGRGVAWHTLPSKQQLIHSIKLSR